MFTPGNGFKNTFFLCQQSDTLDLVAVLTFLICHLSFVIKTLFIWVFTCRSFAQCHLLLKAQFLRRVFNCFAVPVKRVWLCVSCACVCPCECFSIHPETHLFFPRRRQFFQPSHESLKGLLGRTAQAASLNTGLLFPPFFLRNTEEMSQVGAASDESFHFLFPPQVTACARSNGTTFYNTCVRVANFGGRTCNFTRVSPNAGKKNGSDAFCFIYRLHHWILMIVV